VIELDARVRGEAPPGTRGLVHDDDAGGELGQDYDSPGRVSGDSLKVRPAVGRGRIARVPLLGISRGPVRADSDSEQLGGLVSDGEQFAIG
jgi:hypothetical protein